MGDLAITVEELSPRDWRELCDQNAKAALGVSLVGFIERWDTGVYHLGEDHPQHTEIQHVRALCPDVYFRNP